jgi:hypothetical protein
MVGMGPQGAGSFRPTSSGEPDNGKPSLGRRALLSRGGVVAAGVVGAGVVATAMAGPASASAPDGGVTVVTPHGSDTTGTTDTDTTNIATALAAGYPVLLTPGVFYITQITFAAGYKLYGSGAQKGSGPPTSSLCTVLKAGSAATSTSMINIPLKISNWQIANLAINGQSSGTQPYPYTAAAICCPDSTAALNNDYGSIDNVSIELSGGDGIYLGANRSFIHVDRCWLYSNANTSAANGINCQGSSNVISRCELSNNSNGFLVTQGMCRIVDSDVTGNTNIGGIIAASGVWVSGISFDQNGQQGCVVGNGATGVSISARFTSNSLNKSGTYAHLDLTGADGITITIAGVASQMTAAGETGGSGTKNGTGGTNVMQGTHFTAQQFGDSQQVSYDIYTNSTTGLVNDFSTYDTVGAGSKAPYVNGHLG